MRAFGPRQFLIFHAFVPGGVVLPPPPTRIGLKLIRAVYYQAIPQIFNSHTSASIYLNVGLLYRKMRERIIFILFPIVKHHLRPCVI